MQVIVVVGLDGLFDDLKTLKTDEIKSFKKERTG
jgi:hypothetical protein